MATLTVRNLDDELRVLLRVRAAGHGRSMEAEARAILRDALQKPAVAVKLGSRIRQRFSGSEDLELLMAERSDMPRAVDFE
jgi:antitoxin FitA